MEDQEKDNLLYRPKSEPHRGYLSDDTFSDSQLRLPPDAPKPGDEVIDHTPAEIREQFVEIRDLINALPESVQFLGGTIDKLIDRIDTVWPGGYDHHTVPGDIDHRKGTLPGNINTIAHIPISENPKLVGLPDLFPKPTNVVIKVEQPRTLVELIKDHYDKDTIQLDQYYLQQLQIIMQRYFQQMLMAMSDCGLSSINDLTKDFDGDEVKIPAGKNIEHLRDFIVRSQVVRNQRTRLFKKSHSVDRTLTHLRSWHAAEQQRERYYDEKYKDSTSYTESHSNSLLRESRSTYDSSYSSALYGMYKYLNSSVMMTNDVLDMTVKEAQAKSMLLKAKVDIFAFDKTQLAAEDGGTAGNSGQAGDGSGSADAALQKSADAANGKTTDSTGTGSSTSGTSTTDKKTDDSSKKEDSGGFFGGLIGDIEGQAGKLLNGVTGGLIGGVAGGIGNLNKGNDVLSKIGDVISQAGGKKVDSGIADILKKSKIDLPDPNSIMMTDAEKKKRIDQSNADGAKATEEIQQGKSDYEKKKQDEDDAAAAAREAAQAKADEQYKEEKASAAQKWKASSDYALYKSTKAEYASVRSQYDEMNARMEQNYRDAHNGQLDVQALRSRATKEKYGWNESLYQRKNSLWNKANSMVVQARMDYGINDEDAD